MASSATYAGSALPDRTIRLLMISPCLDPKKQIECYLHPFQLQAAPPYEALSYTWGDPIPKVEIICDNRPVAIGLNLSDALTRLRLPTATRIVWVDALCIDQNDNNEKSSQVPLMGTIFHQATRVVVWLGQGNPHQIGEAKQIVNIITKACRQYDRDHDLELDGFSRDKKIKVPLEAFTLSAIEGLRALFKRPWFTRVWCVQEICLAQDAIVYWGEHEIEWSEIGVTADWMIGRQIRVLLDNNKIPSSASNISARHAALMFGSNPKQRLSELLGRYRDWKATNPRDKVYGLLSLVKVEAEAEALQVDYNKSVAQVYADTTVAAIRVHMLLNNLAYVAHEENYDGVDEMVSWAPDWEHNNWYMSQLGPREEICPWSAGGGQPVKNVDEHHIGPQQLRLSGIFYDTVTNVSVNNPIDLPEDTDEDTNEYTHEYNNEDPDQVPDIGGHWKKHIFTLETFLAKTEKPRENRFWHTLARTLTAGEHGDANYISSTKYDSQHIHYLGFISLMRQLLTESADHSFELASVPPGHDSSIYVSEASCYCGHRRLFRTRNDSIGLGPACMRPDDIVVVLYGGNTPYVLRPRGDKYLFMGQAYVDEIMHGELFQELEKGNRKEQEFCII
jgi:hypothetical protein